MEETYKYYRLGRLKGRSSQISHVAFEQHKEGGRIILADVDKAVLLQEDLTEKELLDFYLWLKYRIEDITTSHLFK